MGTQEKDMPLKTDYSEDLREIIKKMFSPSSPDGGGDAMTIQRIHGQVTNILPEKWIEQSDVYDVLKSLGFEPAFETTITKFKEDEETKIHYHRTLKYFVKLNL